MAQLGRQITCKGHGTFTDETAPSCGEPYDTETVQFPHLSLPGATSFGKNLISIDSNVWGKQKPVLLTNYT